MSNCFLPRAYGFVAIVFLWTPASAQPGQPTSYSYYAVTGNSIAEIYASMIRGGPRVNGADAFAATTVSTAQGGKLVQGQNCQMQNFRLKMNFTIRMPKLADSADLSPADRVRWQQFAQFVQRHEETHRSIWIDCGQALESQVKALTVSNCTDANSQASRLSNMMFENCSRKQVAFDAAQNPLLVKQPLVRQVLSRR